MRGRQPVSVTTTRSSTRTPPIPGRYRQLDGDHVAGLEDSRVGGMHRGKFVNVEAHAVAGSVAMLTMAGIPDDRPTSLIHGSSLDAGTHGRDAGSLSLGDESVNLDRCLVSGVGAADDKRSRHVAAVAVDQAADIDHDEITGLHDPVGRASVWERSVRAGANDGLVAGSRGAGGSDAVIEGLPDLAFGHARHEELFHPGQDTIDNRSPGDAGQLSVVFHAAVRRHPCRRHGSTPPAVSASHHAAPTR